MELPLYFALSGKNAGNPEPVIEPVARYYSSGSSYPRTDILIITDKLQSISSEALANEVCSVCEEYDIQGVLFDFERPICAYFVRFAELVMKSLTNCYFILPRQYAAISASSLILCTPCLPTNFWESFCKQMQKAYPNRWALELIPYQLLYEKGKKVQLPYRALGQMITGEGQLLPQAVCMSTRAKTHHLIYDTAQTLRNKLDLAEENGCQLAIGLWQELQYYF